MPRRSPSRFHLPAPTATALACAALTGALTAAHAQPAAPEAVAPAASSAPSAAPEDAALPAVRVKASSDDESATGPVIGYQAKRSATATKTDTPLHETPQSVSVITRDLMQDQAATSVQDALLYGAGARANNYGVDSRGDWVRVRGTEPTQYLDGLQLFFGFNNNARPEVYGLERIELLRGPSSVLYGQGSTGGVMSLVSKRPQAERENEIGLQVGSFNRRQLQADFTGPLTQDGQWLYRLVAVVRKSDTQVDHVPDDRLMLAPSLTWRPNAATRLTLQGHWQDDDSGSSATFLPFSGTVLPNPNGRIPTHRFASEPGFDAYDTQRRSLGWLLEHRLNEQWTLRQNARFMHSKGDYRTLYPLGNFLDRDNPYSDPAQRLISRAIYVNQRNARVTTVDQHVEGTLRTGALQHRLLAGFDFTRYSESARSGSGVSPDFDLYAPVYGNFTPPALTADPDLVQRTTGVYLQDQVRLGDWSLLGGLRHDRLKSAQQGADTERDSATTRRVALRYGRETGWAPYASYSESFQPLAGDDVYNQRFKPLRGAQTEAGLKYLSADGATRFSAAAYRLQEKNRPVQDPANAVNQVQAGQTRTRGVELDFASRLARRLDLIASYAYTDIDAQLEAVPRHQGSVWGKWRFDVAGQPGFSTGLGVRVASGFADGSAADGYGPKVAGYALFDALLAYDMRQWRFALNANNLADRIYVATCLRRGDCWYAARRNVTATATYRW